MAHPGEGNGCNSHVVFHMRSRGWLEPKGPGDGAGRQGLAARLGCTEMLWRFAGAVVWAAFPSLTWVYLCHTISLCYKGWPGCRRV